MSNTDFVQKITADPTGFELGWKKAIASAQSGSSAINAQFKGIGDSIGLITKAFVGFAALVGGGAALKGIIEATTEWGEEALKMSERLGMSTQQASILNVALRHLGIESGTYDDAASKLSKQIQGNGQAFEVMGVQVRDATGHYRPVADVMQDVNEKLVAMHNPIAQNIAGQQVYGKGWDSVREILRLTRQGMEDAEAQARKLGLIVGPEGAAMARQYTEQLVDVGLIGKSLEIQIGYQLLPVFVKLGKFMGEEGPAMGKVFADSIRTIGGIAAMTWVTLKDMGDGLGAMVAQAQALLHFDLAGFKAIGQARDEEAAKNEAAFEKVKAMMFGASTPPGGAEGGGVGAGHHGEDDPNYHFKQKGDNKKATSRMPEWEAELAERKAALERQGLLEGQYREMSKAEEAKYWADLLAMQGLSQQERLALARKAAEAKMTGIKQDFEAQVATLQAEAAAFKNNTDERMKLEVQIQAKYAQGTKEYETAAKAIVEIQRQAADQERTIRESRVQAGRDAALQTLALEEQTMQTALQLGLITNAQVLAGDQVFENKRNAIAKAALQERMQNALLDPDRNPVEVEKINVQLEQLENQHQLKLKQIDSQATIEKTKYQTEFFTGLQSNTQSSFAGILNGTETLGTGMKKIWVGIGASLADTVAKMAADWLVGQLKMRVASKETSMLALNNDALTAAGKAYNAIVGIPFVGPFLAPAAAAVAYAGVMAFGAGISAEGGFDIPGNVNPIVQTHASEMVLPKKQADVIRGMANGGGGGATHLHVHATDAESVKRLFHNNGAALVEVLQKQRRNFAF